MPALAMPGPQQACAAAPPSIPIPSLLHRPRHHGPAPTLCLPSLWFTIAPQHLHRPGPLPNPPARAAHRFVGTACLLHPFGPCPAPSFVCHPLHQSHAPPQAPHALAVHSGAAPVTRFLSLGLGAYRGSGGCSTYLAAAGHHRSGFVRWGAVLEKGSRKGM